MQTLKPEKISDRNVLSQKHFCSAPGLVFTGQATKRPAWLTQVRNRAVNLHRWDPSKMNTDAKPARTRSQRWHAAAGFRYARRWSLPGCGQYCSKLHKMCFFPRGLCSKPTSFFWGNFTLQISTCWINCDGYSLLVLQH